MRSYSSARLPSEGNGKGGELDFEGGVVGGGDGGEVSVVAVEDVNFAQVRHEAQFGETRVELIAEVALEGRWVDCEILHGSVVDVIDVARGGIDRIGDFQGATVAALPSLEFLGDLLGLEVLVITVHDGVEARSTGEDGLYDGAACITGVPLADATGEVLDVIELVAIAHGIELRAVLEAIEGRVDSGVGGVHDCGNAVGEHRHERARLAVDVQCKDAGVGHVLAEEASDVLADLLLSLLCLLELLGLAVEGLRGALRHGALASGVVSGRDRGCFPTTRDHMCTPTPSVPHPLGPPLPRPPGDDDD